MTFVYFTAVVLGAGMVVSVFRKDESAFAMACLLVGVSGVGFLAMRCVQSLSN